MVLVEEDVGWKKAVGADVIKELVLWIEIFVDSFYKLFGLDLLKLNLKNLN